MPTRQGPTESAKNFTIGTKKRGNDGNMWVIIQTKNSKRWSKVNNTKKTNNQINNQINNQNKTKKYTIIRGTKVFSEAISFAYAFDPSLREYSLKRLGQWHIPLLRGVKEHKRIE